ncbi:MAG: hypothetical protein ACOYY2_13810 [Actinomycetota bacterium]
MAALTGWIDLPGGWDRIPAAYVGFGDTCAEELAEARNRGWPVSVMVGRHLHMLCDSTAVAGEIRRQALAF